MNPRKESQINHYYLLYFSKIRPTLAIKNQFTIFLNVKIEIKSSILVTVGTYMIVVIL